MSHNGSIFRPGLFADQVVLVTGGGTGIGRCVALELASLGATTVLAARREEPLQVTTDQIRASGGRADWLRMDVRDSDRVEQALSEVIERHGRLDGLVNNAGGQFPSPAEMMSPNGWRTVIDLNLNGTYLVTRAAFHAWMGEHGGSIVSIVADMWNGFPYMSHTGAARAGVVNLTKSLAVEWAARHIRVNAVAPGLIDSSGLDTYAPGVREGAVESARYTPAGRLGTESEVSAAVVFLLSPAAVFVSGETLRVDGAASLARRPVVEMGNSEPFPTFDAFAP